MKVQSPGSAVAVVLAAGRGTRVGSDGNKAYLPLAGRRMVSWTLSSMTQVPELKRILLVIRPEDRKRAESTLDRELPDADIELVEGGRSRHESEYKALQYLSRDIESGAVSIVLIHDAARPLAGPGLMRAAVSVAREFGGAIPALTAADLVEIAPEGGIRSADGARMLVRVQTPQAFRAKPLLRAYTAAVAADFEGTDTSSTVEQYSDIRVRSFQGDERNLKVTYAHDVFLAERLLADSEYRLN